MGDVALRIMVDIFCGRNNPVVEFAGEKAQEAVERLQPVGRAARPLPPVPTLGYRGLIIEQIGMATKTLPKVFRLAHGDIFGPNFAQRAKDREFENFFWEFGLPPEIDREWIKKNVIRFLELREAWPHVKQLVWPTETPCRCAPLYEPDWWNALARQWYNNCYNYATNYLTDTFAQPGRAAGQMCNQFNISCDPVRSAAVGDGLVDSPATDNKCPKEGHLVALVVWPGVDFHWYRKGRNEYWSHKPGHNAVTNQDNSGNTIPDPRTANRGPYTDFCTFMVVMDGHVRIG